MAIPVIFKDDVFIQAFEKAEIAKYGQAELDIYENSLKIYRDLKGVIDTAFVEGKIEGITEGKIEGKKEGIIEGKKEGIIEGKKEGIIEGKKEGIIEGELAGKKAVAKALLENGVPIDIIIKTTGFSENEINKL